jgi:glycerol-3-phosphate dehydrogenase
MTKNIAKSGVFGTSIKEVERSNLYEVFYFAMAEKVETDLHNEHISSSTNKR